MSKFETPDAKEIDEAILNDEEVEELEVTFDANGKKIYKRKFGSGTKKPTDEKKSACPLCGYHYKRLNEQHLIHIHKMTLEDLEKSNPEFVRYFTDPEYCLKMSGFGEPVEEVLDPVDLKDPRDENGIEGVAGHFHGILDSICEHFGHNREDENFTDTPKRVSKAWAEQLYGMKNTEEQLAEIFKDSSQFPSKYDGIVVQTNIKAYGKCMHHFENVEFNVHIAYKPKNKKVGLSKLARCADVLCSRLVLHEQACYDIAEAIMKHLDPEGCAVVVEGYHDCMSTRGAKQPTALTTCSEIRGCFKYNPDIKKEFFDLVNKNK